MLKASKAAKNYVLLSFIFLILLVFISYRSHGSYTPYFFFGDEKDTGMDFFNSLAEASSDTCYTVYHTVYPPFANEIFHKLALLIPGDIKAYLPRSHTGIIYMRDTGYDLRCHQSPLLLYTFFITAYAAMLFCIVTFYFLDNVPEGLLLSLSVLISYGSLTALERGNIVLFAMLFTMVFLFGYDDPDIRVRYTAFLSIAAAASLKIYPAAYGLMIFTMRDKIKELLKYIALAVSAALFLSLLPLRHLGGAAGLRLFIKTLFDFNNGNGDDLYYTYGVKGIVDHFAADLGRRTGIHIHDTSELAAFILTIILMLLIYAFILHIHLGDSSWQAAFDITLAVILIQARSCDYTLLFFIPVLLMLLKEDACLRWQDIPRYIMLLVFILPYPTPMCNDIYNSVLHHVDIIQIMLPVSAAYDFSECLLRYLEHRRHHPHNTHHTHFGHRGPCPAGALTV